MQRRAVFIVALGLCVLGVFTPIAAQRAGVFRGSSNDPAIRYTTATLSNPIVDVNKKLRDGTLRLTYDGRGGFLNSALDALQLSVDSQLLVFSRASLQARFINEQNPRSIYFNDRVALGWVRDGPLLEVAVHDDTAGVVFYTLEQRREPTDGPPQFERAFQCLGCHLAGDTLGVPGLLMFSTTRPDEVQTSGVPRAIDQSDPLDRRFGGWFVTGSAGRTAHMGNDATALDGRRTRELVTTEGLYDPDGYPAASSDIVAHLVFTHQARMANLLTRAGWEARAADPTQHPPFTSNPDEEARIAVIMSAVARDVVDYLLFIDESALPAGVRGASGFAERFSTMGPRDRKGRSLRELDLSRRLMKYPCSYLIYSPAFDALPRAAKEPIYNRLWQVLSGQETDER
jgi:hypothetical protein